MNPTAPAASPPSPPGPRRIGRRLVAALVSLPMILLGVTSCKGGNAAQRLADSTAPTLEGSMGKCKPGNEGSKSLVVEWAMGDRAALESRIKQGLVAVRYRNCEMELITTCTVAGHYNYLSVTPKSENVKITNADELYAKIPIGAVKLEGKLARDGQLNVDMTLVGRYESETLYFKQADLAGRCEGATHVVTGLSVGAFEFYSGAGADIGVGAEVKGTGVGAGAGSTASKEVLNRDGDQQACYLPAPPPAEGEEALPGPPIGCGAALQVEVVPIDRPQVQATTSSSTIGKLTDTTDVAGESLATDTLDKRIKAMTFMALSGYAIAVSGGVLVYVGLAQWAKNYGADSTSSVGLAGSDERSKFISRYNLARGLTFGGIGGFALGLGLGLFATVRGKKLRNERSTRLAGVDVSPIPGGGAMLGARWRF